MPLTFVDTGAFIALILKADNYHSAAIRIYADLMNGPARLVTTNHVINETCTWLARDTDAGHRPAVDFGQSMLKNPNVSFWNLADDMPIGHKFLIVSTPPDIERRALTIFSRYDTAGFSFTDCVSFAVMQKLGIKKAFSFDHHFDILGFERL